MTISSKTDRLLGNWQYIQRNDFDAKHSAVDDPANWHMLNEIDLKHGDVLIKHVWPKDVVNRSASQGGRGRHKLEELITSHSSKMNRLLGRGSRSAEHTAVICTDGKTNVFLESDGGGVQLKEQSVTQSHRNDHAYTVYRANNRADSHLGWEVLVGCLGMRLTFKGDRATGTMLKTMANKASRSHYRKKWDGMVDSFRVKHDNVQAKTSYGVVTMLTMNLPGYKSIPDFIGTSNDAKLVNFIMGRRGGRYRRKMSHICSGLTSTLLQAWMVSTNRGRVFSDPSQAHPRDLERRLLAGGFFPGFERVGRWGTYNDYKPRVNYHG